MIQISPFDTSTIYCIKRMCIKCKPDITFFNKNFAFYNNKTYLCRKQSYCKNRDDTLILSKCYYNKIQD